MPGSAEAEPVNTPPWEKRYPGRMDYELARLKEAGANPIVDDTLLARGVLAIDLVWKVDGEEVKLWAVYPGGFPHLRPNVSLRGDPATFPERHCNPHDGSLCLLGRDTAQWVPSWTLAHLLESQLENALKGSGDEDPQGEPAEVWWNDLSLQDSYCLIDSGWNIGSAEQGTLRIRYVGKGGQSPRIQAAVTEVWDASGALLAEWQGPLPEAVANGKSTNPPWVRVEGTFLPQGQRAPRLEALLREHPQISRLRPTELVSGLHGYLFCVVYDAELGFGQTGDGWMVGLMYGSRKAFKQKGAPNPKFQTVRILRAGPDDTGVRVPAVATLRDKKIALFGLGAIGAPLAVELARNQCGELRILDRDIVEPGNSIRWTLGSSAWGRNKTAVMSEFLQANFPRCDVRPCDHTLGQNGGDSGDDSGDDEVLQRMLDGVDVAVDAMASHGVTTLVHDYASERGIPLVSFWATPSVAGGGVACYVPGSGCPVCLEHHHHEGSIPVPPGTGEEKVLMQPPGCAERTFTGGSFDLTELSLEAFRMVLDTVRSAPDESVVRTLSLEESGVRIPPSWRTDALPPHDKCSCR